MKKIDSKRALAGIDALLIVGMVLCLVSDKNISGIESWDSFHCVQGVVWFAFIILHAWQHRRLISLFCKKNVILKNKITALTIIVFILMFSSIVYFTIDITSHGMHFHNIASHLFMIIVIVHTITKLKRWIHLVRKEPRFFKQRI